jgi:argininosuccinate synthase
MSRIVLAYSGSARSSIALRWMIEAWQAEVVTLTLDLGQRDELDAVRERALACGALRAHVLDERERFARDYLLRALRAGAASDAGWPLGRLLTRPLLARQLVDVAKMEGITDIAHGAGRDPEDRLRLERAMRDAGPDLIVRAPLVDAEMTDDELLAFAEEHDLPIPPPSAVDANLWERCERGPVAGAAAEAAATLAQPVRGNEGVTLERQAGGLDPGSPRDRGGLRDAGGRQDREAAASSADAARAPDSPAVVAIEFLRGTPVGLNGVAMPLLEMLSSLETIAGAQGMGRTQRLVRLGDGAVVSQRCEAPAAMVLDAALQQLQRLVLPDDAVHDAQRIAALYRDILARGAWAAASRRGCDAFVDTIQTRATGTVRVRLLRGTISVMDCALADEHAEADVARVSR